MKQKLKIILLSGVFSIQSVFAATIHQEVKLSEKQVLNLGNGDEPKTLDAQKCNETGCIAIIAQLYEGLVDADSAGNIQPAAAQSWEISKDGRTYTFTLRPNLKWSDGSDLTAADFEYGFKRLVSPKTASENAAIIENVLNAQEINLGKKEPDTLGVKALSKNKLQVQLVHPDPAFLDILAAPALAPANQSNIEKMGENNFTKAGNLVSNGPFLLSYWKIGDKVVIIKNPNYWNAKQVMLKEARFFSVVDSNTEFKMYEAGQLDSTLMMSADQFKSIKAKYGGSELRIDPSLSSYYYMFNIQKAPFKDNLKLRQALSMTVDRDVISGAILGMGQKPIYDLVPFGIKNYKQSEYSWARLPKDQKIALAKKLYQEAGYSENNRLKIHITYNTNENHRKIATAIASMWRRTLGVNAIAQNEEWKSMLDNRTQGNYEIMRLGGVASYDHAYTFLQTYRSFDPANPQKYNNKQYDDLMAQAISMVKMSDRQRLMEKADKIFMEDYTIIPIYSYVNPYLVKPYVKGFEKNAMQIYRLENVYLIDSNTKSAQAK